MNARATLTDAPDRDLNSPDRIRASDPVSKEYVAESNLLLTRSRSDLGEVKLLTARRRDILRRTDEGLRIARGEIYLNQTTIDMHSIAMFF